ncbi:MAG: hypothetical protein JST54_23635 [Deltaproteobacteria bacterium]|nr:hypothetical protein [Deltaproteobacteria bacterium]
MTLAALAVAVALNAAPSPAFNAKVETQLKQALARQAATATTQSTPAKPAAREGRTPRPVGR